MRKDDWYRNPRWNSQIEAEFQARLARARSQRDQYLVIQAITIEATHPRIALKLVNQYFETKESTFHDVRALNARANAYVALGDDARAVEAMKAVLEIESAHSNQKTHTFVDYPYLVATRGLRPEFMAALSVLDARYGDAAFPASKFKWHASKSFIHLGMNEIDLAKKHARLALDVAQLKRSGFHWHQSLGLVGPEYRAAIDRLQKILDK